MSEMNYFIPSETFDKAIKEKEKGVLKALLIGIIGGDPTFATTEFEEANKYIKEKSEKMNGSAIDLSEDYIKQEDEYFKTQDTWDEEYYRMLLVWYRDNYADERLTNIKTVGNAVFKNKPTWGKSKQQSRLICERQKAQSDTRGYTKNPPIVIAAGNDARTKRLPIVEKIKNNWKWVAAIAAVIAVVTAIICLLSNK